MHWRGIKDCWFVLFLSISLVLSSRFLHDFFFSLCRAHGKAAIFGLWKFGVQFAMECHNVHNAAHTHTHSRKYKNGGICVIWVIDIWSCDMFLLVILYAINIFFGKQNCSLILMCVLNWEHDQNQTRTKETDKKLQQIYKSRQKIEKWVDSFCCCS